MTITAAATDTRIAIEPSFITGMPNRVGAGKPTRMGPAGRRMSESEILNELTF